MLKICRLNIALFSAFLVSSCVSTPTSTALPQQKIDASFERRAITNRIGPYKGARVYYYLKAFDQDGKLAVCGAYLDDKSGVSEVWAKWVYEASVSMGLERTIVAPASFMNGIYKDQPEKMARCIKTQSPADPFRYSLPRLVGEAVLMY